MFWSRPDLQVLFVCTANICRSPLAEALLRHRLQAMGLAGRVQVSSAGTRVVQGGHRPDARMQALAAEAGVAMGRIRSRVLTPAMIQRSDYSLVMDRTHLKEAGRLCEGLDAGSFEPVRLLGSYLPGHGDGANIPDIPDPYFGDMQGFRLVYGQIDVAVSGLLVNIVSRLEGSREAGGLTSVR